MKFKFIDDNKSHWRTQKMCQVLNVSESGYYSWRKRLMSKREKAEQELEIQVRKVFVKSRGTYGCRRIHEQLKRQGVVASEYRIAKIKQKKGIYARGRAKYKVTTDSRHNLPVAPNLWNQQFQAEKPNQIWVSDITYVNTDEGWLYLCIHMDLCDKIPVGYSFSDRIKKELVIESLRMALKGRLLSDGLICHSDRGSQYCSHEYQQILMDHQIRCSMSRKGNCYDNAPSESFHATIKKEYLHGRRFRTRQEAILGIFEYIEVFNLRERLHSSLGYMAPEEYHQKITAA